jgi:hypothetical protein
MPTVPFFCHRAHIQQTSLIFWTVTINWSQCTSLPLKYSAFFPSIFSILTSGSRLIVFDSNSVANGRFNNDLKQKWLVARSRCNQIGMSQNDPVNETKSATPAFTNRSRDSTLLNPPTAVNFTFGPISRLHLLLLPYYNHQHKALLRTLLSLF